MFGLGTTELLIVAFIVLVLFGSRLPSVMRSLGQGVVEFKKGLQGVEGEKDSTTKIEDQSNRPQTNNEAKPAETESVQR
jgi:sec-independent protein translocase protein TatA